MSAGGVQTLMKSQFLRPGQRFVLAGSHPLLLLVADLLLKSGAQVAEVAFARPAPGLADMLSHWRALPGHFAPLKEAARALLNLRRQRVPIRFGTLITRAEGEQQVQRVTLSCVTPTWEPVAGSERSLEADTLVVGYGLLASSELARQAGCAMQWKPAEGGWTVVHDEQMRTSQSRIFVAGEPAGVGGAELAAIEGRIAALQATLDLRGPGSASRPRACARHSAPGNARCISATPCSGSSNLAWTRWPDWRRRIRPSAAARKSRPAPYTHSWPTIRTPATSTASSWPAAAEWGIARGAIASMAWRSCWRRRAARTWRSWAHSRRGRPSSR